MNNSTIPDLRNFPRTNVRTPATVFMPTAEGIDSCRAWTDDLSPSGALVLTEQPIPQPAFLLRVYYPGLQDYLLECRRARQGVTQIRRINLLQEWKRYSCGVHFTGICSDPELIALLQR